MLKYLYNNDQSKKEKRYMKVSKTHGIDPKGNEIQMEESYMSYLKFTTHNKLAILVNHLMNRIQHITQSFVANLHTYLRSIKKKAKEKVERDPDLIDNYSKNERNCRRSQFYSILYGIKIPCIHQILNETWADNDITADLS